MIGLGIFTMAFINSPIQFQIALGLIGFGFITWGFAQVKREQKRKRNEERFDVLVTKLDEIQQELKKEDSSKGTGVAVADVLSSGLQFYAEYMNRQQK